MMAGKPPDDPQRQSPLLSRLLFFPRLGVDGAALRRHLAGKTVLITGASYGIGEALALRLAPTGARLLLVARTEAKLREVAARVEAVGGHAESLPCDLTAPEQVEGLLAALRARPDGVDVVVSNAGRSIRRSIFDALDRLHDVTRTMTLNYVGPVQLLLGLIPTLVARRGQIVNVSAVNVLLPPMARWAAYQASKVAFDQWFRSVGAELRPRGVATTSVYLPLVRTRMIEPTAMYRRAPAMQPDEAAALLCRALLSRRRHYAPWWLPLARLGASLLGTLHR